MDWYDRFCAHFPDPSWSALLFGLERGLYASKRVILFAGDYLLEHPEKESGALLELAVASPSDHAGVIQALKILASAEPPSVQAKAVRRWRYLFLLDVAHPALSSEALLEKVESVWCDFGHPSDMNQFIGWMPPEAGSETVPPRNWHDWTAQRFNDFMAKEREELA